MDICGQLEEIRDILMVEVERGTNARVTRAYVLTENLLEQFFHDADDRAELPDQVIELGADPAHTWTNNNLPR